MSPGKALLIRTDWPTPPDRRLPIFSHANVGNLFKEIQLWVSPDYTPYRHAWKRTLGPAEIEGKVLHHVYNRRMARLRGIGYIRLAPVSRRANSSSAYTEQWGVDLFTSEYVARFAKHNLRMQFADLGDLLVMLDISLGGGVQDVFRIGQNFVEIPGRRPPQV
ncbi:MAG: hypothetical protein COA78_00325 [Blastopirellula sp.]|nr:MAG: hypothetical protein COA78_00325 [Blastopirellula sp.]